MGMLETKRNAMLVSAIQSGQLTNLIPDNLTWQAGYFTGNGTISSAGSITKEKYEEEFIEIDTTKTYVLYFEYTTYKDFWAGINAYDTNGSWVKRYSPAFQPFQRTDGSQTLIIQRFTEPKIRISLRTYGNCKISMFEYDELINLIANESNYIQVGD